ncbi:MAG: hypothetical protein U9Q81_25735 [Pseudomonadota bacterium]|nr:hypothetical protein [Pseudomonadota bacterium]
MTKTQSQTIWELCRYGFQLAAYEAEAQWGSGEAYLPDLHCKLPRELEHFIERCNRQAREYSRALSAANSPDPRSVLGDSP